MYGIVIIPPQYRYTVTPHTIHTQYIYILTLNLPSQFNTTQPEDLMSWQDFIDKGLLEGGVVREAAIFGIDGGIWAQSAGCNISEDEQRAIVDGLNDPPLREIRVGGRKYRCTMSSLDVILSKLTTSEPSDGRVRGGGGGCIIKKTNQAVIVAEYPSKSSEMDVLAGVEQLGNYFITQGY
ncbi:profilin [Pisolithus thermaeus]|nr:profilin [Pisolithus thermaeus]